MIRHAARAVPWGRVGVAAALVIVMMELVHRWPWATWPLQGVAVGLLAGAVAICFDEPAAAVVDAAPRGLAWRTAARAAGVLGLLVAWLLAVERAGDSLFGHQGEVALQGVAGVISASAWVTWRRTAGEACPGIRLALGVVPLVTAWSLVRPFSEAVPVFPYAVGGGDLGDWDTSRVAWQVFAVAAAVLLAAALAEVRWWWVRSPRSVDSGP